MDAPANTLNYMIAGYIVIFGVMAVYIASLVMRFKRSLKMQKTIMDMKKE
jgi:hypothetical protein